MTKITCMVVDDQHQSIDLIKDHIEQVPILSLRYETTNPVHALGFLDNEKVDCIFLDVDMPQLSGLEFIEALKSKFGNDIPKIILITGYDTYALSGYDYGVFDYLLKPVNFKRFKIAADRLLASFNQTKKEPVTFFFADVDGEKIKINFSDIICIEAAGNYISIYTDKKKYTCYNTLNGMQEILPESEFIRVHKSFIASVSSIQSVRGNELFVTVNGATKRIPIGITYKEKLLKALRIA